MNAIETLKQKQAEELASLERELAFKAALEAVIGPLNEDARICLHGKYITVSLWNDFRTEKKLVDAVEVVEKFKNIIVEGEHWKSGCVSTWPAEINSCIKDENVTMDGAHAVEIEVRGGRGYGPNVSVNFWTRIGGELCEISCPVCDLWKLVPSVRGQYNSHGDFTGDVVWPVAETQTADKFRKFWSEAPNYNGSYYLADVPNFMAWASTHGKKEVAA